MKKKFISLLVVSAMAATMIAGCGNSAAPAASTPAAEPAQSEAPAPAATTAETTADTAADDAAGDADYSDVTLTMWSMWNSTEPQGKVIQEAADAFKEKTGATVNIEWKGRDVKQIIMTALEGGEDIDIFEEDYSRIGKSYKDYCLDLTDMAKAAKFETKK